MTGNIDNLRSILNRNMGVAQPCHYICTITPPVSMVSGGNLIVDALKFLLAGGVTAQLSVLAEQAEIPGRQFATTPHKIFGTTRLMPYGVIYDTIRITFICTNMMSERTFFDVWHQFIMSPSSQYMEYYKDYVGQITIQKVNNDPGIVNTLLNSSSTDSIVAGAQATAAEFLSTYTLEEAYPVAIQPQELSFADDGYLRLTVEFAYARYKCSLDKIFPGKAGVSSPFFEEPPASIFDELKAIGGSVVDYIGNTKDFDI